MKKDKCVYKDKEMDQTPKCKKKKNDTMWMLGNENIQALRENKYKIRRTSNTNSKSRNNKRLSSTISNSF